MAENTPVYTAIMLVTTTPAWLALSHDERDAFNDAHVNPIFAKYADRVKVRLLDAEAFTGRCTDVILFRRATSYNIIFWSKNCAIPNCSRSPISS